jgi:hypothetical protein
VPDATPRGADTAARNGDYQRYLGGRVAGHLNAYWDKKKGAIILMYVFCMSRYGWVEHNPARCFCFLHQTVGRRQIACFPRSTTNEGKTLAHPGTLPISSGRRCAKIVRFQLGAINWRLASMMPFSDTPTNRFHHVSIRTPQSISIPFPLKKNKQLSLNIH